jgi:hypothetical protein
MCSAKCDVRFTPDNDRKSGFPASSHVGFTIGRVLRNGDVG